MELPGRQPEPALNTEEAGGTRMERNRRLHRWARRQAILAGFFRAAACCAVLFLLLFQGVGVADASMAPAILPGETLLSFRWMRYLSSPRRGDIAVHERDGQTRVLRVIALAGERVSAFEGRVYVNGQLLEEPYAQDLLPHAPEQTIPEGHVYLLPDSRGDARGVVAPFGELAGRVVLRVAPLGRIALF